MIQFFKPSENSKKLLASNVKIQGENDHMLLKNNELLLSYATVVWNHFVAFRIYENITSTP